MPAALTTPTKPESSCSECECSCDESDGGNLGAREAEEEEDEEQPLAEKRVSTWKQFCRSAGIHGLHYLARDGSSKLERTFWAFCLLVSLGGCCALLSRMYYRWESTPSISTSEIRVQPLFELPMPAVTICPELKIKRSALDGMEGNETVAQLEQGLNSMLCENTSIPESMKTIGKDQLDFLVDVAPKFSDFVFGFRRKNMFYSSLQGDEDGFAVGEEFWQPILTDEGLCYTINLLTPAELFKEDTAQRVPPHPDPPNVTRLTADGWDPVTGYATDKFNMSADDSYPVRAKRNALNGFFVAMCVPETDMDYSCRGPLQGFKAVLHSPTELPHMQDSVRVQLGEETLMQILPYTTSTSTELAGLDPFRRGCYFPGERQLRHFEVYTQNNCELECAANASHKACGCVSFYMPRSPDTPMCGPGSNECVREAEVEQTLLEMNAAAKGRGTPSETGCNCLPSCEAIEYRVDEDRANFEWLESVKAWRYPFNFFEGKDCARVSVFFKNNAAESSLRNELYSTEKFYAACAAVLGLFTGFSIINLVEAAYFLFIGVKGRLTRRFCSPAAEKKKTKKKSAEDKY
ncbi:pickpocket protein 28-like [Frankliniella occidentalis]|uniref:Pickpocket protein 28-like n=1 Tax=Frankliniella occidentalis TaxID=133901 RepID=A0A9C6UB32_FRAOC|nr:pickpocket protein 28-like [Frankliniella occidentalis]